VHFIWWGPFATKAVVRPLQFAQLCPQHQVHFWCQDSATVLPAFYLALSGSTVKLRGCSSVRRIVGDAAYTADPSFARAQAVVDELDRFRANAAVKDLLTMIVLQPTGGTTSTRPSSWPRTPRTVRCCAGPSPSPTRTSFQGLQLANLALQIGVSWEGLPALGITATLEAGFEASIAVFFDAVHPAQSLLAGSLSDLTLHDVLVDLAGVDPPDLLAPVLGAIGVTGTHAFTVDGALGADLDALRFDRLAAAFHDGAGIPLPTSPRQLLVDRAEDGTRWYLTDMTTMRHYQLVRTATGIEVSVEAQIYLAPRPPG
jgi:hypothetical protein